VVPRLPAQPAKRIVPVHPAGVAAQQDLKLGDRGRRTRFCGKRRDQPEQKIIVARSQGERLR
jgi:hypothetical protein